MNHEQDMENELKPIANPYGWEEPQSEDFECCSHCGRAIKNPEKSEWIHIIDGGERIAPANWEDRDNRIDDDGNMLWYQIGPICKRKIPSTHRKKGSAE